MTIIDEELKLIKTDILSNNPLIWTDYSLLQTHTPDERLDNNYYSTAYENALLWLKKLDDTKYEIKTIGEIKADIFTGLEPKEEGDIPLIEKTNIKPNVILPSFEKFTTLEGDEDKRMIIQTNDLLLSKDGSPGVVCAVSENLINALKKEFDYEYTSIAIHVYKIVLKENYKEYASFIGAFMNSKLGQALVRRYISGSVSPTIRTNDVDRIIIVIPKDNMLSRNVSAKLGELQLQAIAYSKYVQYSNELVSMIFGSMPDLPKLPINWMPGGRKDPHGYDKEDVHNTC